MIIHELRKTNSSIDKKHILRTQASDSDKIMFRMTYERQFTYHCRWRYINMDTVKPFTTEDQYLLLRLSQREITGNEAIDAVTEHCAKHGDLVKLMCNKDLDCGVSVKTLLDVFGKNFLTVHSVQLATEVPIAKVSLPIHGEIKYNGTRVTALVTEDGVKLLTRNGHEFDFPALQNVLSYCIEPIMLDGELAFGDSQNSDHTVSSGIVNSAIKGTPIANTRARGLRYTIFDAMPLEEYYTESCDMQFSERRQLVEETVEYLHDIAGTEDELKLVNVSHLYTFNSHAEIDAKFKELLLTGYEGLILKRADHTYKYKRTKDWIKVKAIRSADLLCSGYTEGQGKYEGAIGTLVCEGVIGDIAKSVKVKVNVGSGLSDADRFSDPAKFIGETIEVLYNDIIQDKSTGEWSLFLPRYKMIRIDK